MRDRLKQSLFVSRASLLVWFITCRKIASDLAFIHRQMQIDAHVAMEAAESLFSVSLTAVCCLTLFAFSVRQYFVRRTRHITPPTIKHTVEGAAASYVFLLYIVFLLLSLLLYVLIYSLSIVVIFPENNNNILIFPAIIIQFFKIQTGRKNPSQKCVYRDCDGFKCLLYDFVLLVIFPNWQAYISRFPICVKACFGIKNSENRLVFLIRHF